MLFKKKHIRKYLGISVQDLPDHFEIDKVYVVGTKGNKWVAALKCPCGCNEIIMLNLLPEGEVCWTTKIHRNKSITIRPSIWRTVGCRSHFTIRAGQINWVYDWD